MKLKSAMRNTNLVQGLKTLKGNALITVIFEVPFGFANVLYSFYLSIYMKGQGVSSTQIGYVISLGFCL